MIRQLKARFESALSSGEIGHQLPVNGYVLRTGERAFGRRNAGKSQERDQENDDQRETGTHGDASV